MRKSYFLKWPMFCEVKQAFSNQTLRKQWYAFPYILGAFNNTLDKSFQCISLSWQHNKWNMMFVILLFLVGILRKSWSIRFSNKSRTINQLCLHSLFVTNLDMKIYNKEYITNSYCCSKYHINVRMYAGVSEAV